MSVMLFSYLHDEQLAESSIFPILDNSVSSLSSNAKNQKEDIAANCKMISVSSAKLHKLQGRQKVAREPLFIKRKPCCCNTKGKGMWYYYYFKYAVHPLGLII